MRPFQIERRSSLSCHSAANVTTEDILNTNVNAFDPMPTPEEICAVLPMTKTAETTVRQGRSTLKAIFEKRDPRIFLIVGPCSIHDPKAALDYAKRLKELADEVADSIVLIMRTYFEKPRTSVGWKGYINDPDMDDSCRVDQGIAKARKLLLAINELGLPTGTEALDPISPQYLADLISWYAIGARTTESQTHREMSSGLSPPVGFKNGTDGGLSVAINAMISATSPHNFLGINSAGRISIVRTTGNQYAHIVLRGGDNRPNYDSVSVAITERALAKANLPANIVIDCSHANSLKQPRRQPAVIADGIRQICHGNRSIVGFMIESNLVAGNQPIPSDLSKLVYGQSITDGCIDWASTESMIRDCARELRDVLPTRIV